MNRTNKLGLMVVLITAIVLLGLYGIYWGVSNLLKSGQVSLNPTAVPIATPEVISDRDGDGLSDLIENIYKANPDVADTDSDGVKDGQEIAEGRDPTLPGPDDKLPDVPLANEVVNTNTYTGKYLASLPADLPREQILDRTRIEAFVEENKGELLPPLPSGSVKISAARGKEAVEKYLDQISSSTNPELKLVTSSGIEAAFRASYADPKNSQLRDVRSTLEKNLTILKNIEAPAEVEALHEKLLTATQALVFNVSLLENMSKDFVGGTIGAKNIELLGAVFQDIASQIAALEEKYALD